MGAVCIGYGRPKWPITMLNHTNKQTNKHSWYRIMFCFLFLAPYARTTRYEEAFLPKGKKRPHYNTSRRIQVHVGVSQQNNG